ncbi:uncharacterized protein Triagg1_877 [Trichoderma aggressivum f. europaeum]|uniref:Uncharacterized protein n=1 Tax=Trichoderma aggressivum f. europaeum TaxID=173218 RepID=A0AAE1M9H9_9HYPO|nr:hypothetical protein Triagg1_877 [Trichoderma aggressivum f. europaeum]
MASHQPTPSATEAGESDHPSAPLSAVPRRVQELKTNSHKRLKARSKGAAPKDVHRSLNRRWREQVISNLDAGESFSNHVAILKILRRIPELRDHVPHLVSNDPVTQTYVVRYPCRDLIPFEREVRLLGLSYRKIQNIKSQLYRSVMAMYTNGVRYNIYPQHLYLYGPASWDLTRLLFLGSVTSSDLLDVGGLDWNKERDRVCDQIDRTFAPLEIWTFQEEAADLAKHARTEMDQAMSVINEKNAVIDSAKADLTEAQAIMAEAYQMIKDARATLDGVKAVSKNIYTSVTRPQSLWDDAHIAKEYAETSRRKMAVLNDRANALIQKYGNPKLPNEVGAEDAVSHSDIKTEENAKVKNRIPTIDGIRAMEEPTIQRRSAAIEANLREDGSIGT